MSCSGVWQSPTDRVCDRFDPVRDRNRPWIGWVTGLLSPISEEFGLADNNYPTEANHNYRVKVNDNYTDLS